VTITGIYFTGIYHDFVLTTQSIGQVNPFLFYIELWINPVRFGGKYALSARENDAAGSQAAELF
jgi:hypothetical protein